MKRCINCVHAKWNTTANGRLHPSGDGRCTYEYQLRPLPASRYWAGCNQPHSSGGGINRRQDLKDHCAYFTREESKP